MKIDTNAVGLIDFRHHTEDFSFIEICVIISFNLVPDCAIGGAFGIGAENGGAYGRT